MPKKAGCVLFYPYERENECLKRFMLFFFILTIEGKQMTVPFMRAFFFILTRGKTDT